MKIGELITKSERTGQLRLIDFFGAVTVLAVLLATFAPLLRLIDRENLTLVVTSATAMHVFFHFAVVILAVAYAIYRRKRLQKQAGRRFGVAFCITTKSEYWPRMKCILTLIGLIFIQLFFAVTHFQSQHFDVLALHTIQLALIYGGVVVNFLWRAYPGTIEFFESGIAVRQVFYPWADIELHTSTQSDDRIKLVVSRELTATPQVSKELDSTIRSRHASVSSREVHPLDRAC